MHNDSPVSGMSFSADGKLLAASLASEFVTVYDVESTRPIQVSVGSLRWYKGPCRM